MSCDLKDEGAVALGIDELVSRRGRRNGSPQLRLKASARFYGLHACAVGVIGICKKNRSRLEAGTSDSEIRTLGENCKNSDEGNVAPVSSPADFGTGDSAAKRFSSVYL